MEDYEEDNIIIEDGEEEEAQVIPEGVITTELNTHLITSEVGAISNIKTEHIEAQELLIKCLGLLDEEGKGWKAPFDNSLPKEDFCLTFNKDKLSWKKIPSVQVLQFKNVKDKDIVFDCISQYSSILIYCEFNMQIQPKQNNSTYYVSPIRTIYNISKNDKKFSNEIIDDVIVSEQSTIFKKHSFVIPIRKLKEKQKFRVTISRKTENYNIKADNCKIVINFNNTKINQI